MRKSLGTKIIVPSQTTSAIPIVNPDEEAPAKVVIKPPSKGLLLQTNVIFIFNTLLNRECQQQTAL